MSDAPNTSIKAKLFCSVPACRNFNNPYAAIDLYKLPKDQKQRKKFGEILGIPQNLVQLDTSRVCALHFKSKMKQQALPITLGTESKGTLSLVQNTAGGRPKIITVYCQKSSTGVITTTSTTDVTNTSVKNLTIPEKPPIEIISLEDNVSDITSIADPVEQQTDMTLELQCEEEQLSFAQLNAYFDQTSAYQKAGLQVLSSSNPKVQTSTVSTQTNPVIIFEIDQFSKPKESILKSYCLKENPVKNSAIQNIEITPQVENCAIPLKESTVLNSSPIGLSTSVIDNASFNSSNPVDRSNALPNQSVLAPQGVSHESNASASMPLISLANMAGGTYFTTTISPTTTPSTTVSTATALGDKPKVFTYVNPGSIMRPSGSFSNSTVAFIPPVRQVFPSASSNSAQGIGPAIMQPTYFQNTGQNLLGTSLPVSSASSTLLSFAASASNYTTQLVNDPAGGLVLTSSNPQEPINCISFPNQIRFEAKAPPPYQLPQQLPFQLISLNEKPGGLSSFPQPLDQQIMNEGQLVGPYSNSSFNSDPYPSTSFNSDPYSSRLINNQEFQNFPASNETPYQVLMHKNNDGTKIFFNVPVQGTPQPVFNTLESSSSQDLITIESDPEEKEDELLAMCNVATVYGSGCSTPSDGTSTPDSHTVGGQRNTKSVGPVVEKNSTENQVKKSTTKDTGSSDDESTETDSSQHSMGPLIVDVISATEGAQDYFVGNKMPNILYSKKKKKKSKKLKKKAKKHSKKKNKTSPATENKKDSVYKSIPIAAPWKSNASENTAEKTYSSKDGSSVHLLFKEQNGPVQAVQLHNSVFSLQTSIPIIPNGQQLCSDPQVLLNLKIPIGKVGVDDATTLRKKLTSEKFISCSVMWLIRRNYMPLALPCICGSSVFHVVTNGWFQDGYCWKCAEAKCGRETKIKRPKLFESFQMCSLPELLLLTYHWACQSPLHEILADVNLHPSMILKYFKALRDICHKTLLKKCKLGLSVSSTVETALVKLGDFFVLGALDRKTRYTRLEVITQLEAYSTTVHLDLLGNWLGKRSKLVSDKKIMDSLLPEIATESAVPNVTDPYNTLPHTLNISKYLIDNLTAIFGKVNQNQLPIDIVRGFLYELQWRGKYAKFFDMSFWSIMNHIRDFNDPNEVRTVALPGEINIDGPKATNDALTRWGVPLPLQSGAETFASFYRTQTKGDQLNMPNTSQIKRNVPVIDTTVMINYQQKVRSASELFQDVPEISGGSSNITSNTLLAIKPFAENKSTSGNASQLGTKLQSEGFIRDPIKWLIGRSYLSSKSSCYVCKAPSILRDNVEYQDGCSWMCQNSKCGFQNLFKRPLFFSQFKELTMAQVAAMIFHWTVQSGYINITKDVPIDAIQVCHAWRLFQVVCSSALKKQNQMIGGDGRIIEIAMVQFGRLYVLGARERLTKRTLLKCFSVTLKDQEQLVYDTITSWVYDKSFVVINSTDKFFMSNNFRVFSAETSVTDQTSTRMHVLNITSYLVTNIFQMFGHLQADLVEPELMQMYLDELMWRERFGKLYNLAFSKILYEIFSLERNKSPILLQNYKVKELLKEDKHRLYCSKEVRVILHRIPQTVLKYYKCSPSDYSAPKKLSSPVANVSDSDEESSDSSEDLMEAVSAALEGESLSDVSSPEMNDNPTDDKKPSTSLQIKDCNQNSNHTFQGASDATKPSTSKGQLADSIQPLVLKMNKNRQNYQSYLKSEFLKAKYKRQRSRSKFNSRKYSRKKKVVKKDIPETSEAPIEDTFAGVKIKIEPGTSDTCETLSPTNDCASGSKSVKRVNSLLRRLGTNGEPVCVECGKVVSLDHFMKQFQCTDCKNVVYTTCCSNAFFEHRSALLFGKRMPRRDKVAHGHGLHHFRMLTYAAICPCGFKSKIGNQIASHMVKCQEQTCFYNKL